MVAEVVILLGGNIGDVSGYLEASRELLSQRVGKIVALSTQIQSEAWGFSATQKFTNQALVIETTLSPEELLRATQSIERQVGRDAEAEREQKLVSGQKYASRVIDIDIITYSAEVVDQESLKIPHPLMHEREFVLRPMVEVAPEWRHPVLGRTTREMLKMIE